MSSYSGDWRDPNQGRLGNDCDKYALKEKLSFPKITVSATLFDFQSLSYLTFKNKSCMADDLFYLPKQKILDVPSWNFQRLFKES